MSSLFCQPDNSFINIRPKSLSAIFPLPNRASLFWRKPSEDRKGSSQLLQESGPVVADPEPVAGRGHADNVKATARNPEPLFPQPALGCPQQPFLLGWTDRSHWTATTPPPPTPDLDEDDLLPFLGDDVDFPPPVSNIAGQDDQTLGTKVLLGQSLSRPPLLRAAHLASARPRLNRNRILMRAAKGIHPPIVSGSRGRSAPGRPRSSPVGNFGFGKEPPRNRLQIYFRLSRGPWAVSSTTQPRARI